MICDYCIKIYGLVSVDFDFFEKFFKIFLGGLAGYCPPVLLRLLIESFTGLDTFAKVTNFTIPLF